VIDCVNEYAIFLRALAQQWEAAKEMEFGTEVV